MNLSDYHSLIESQHRQLSKLLADEPALSELKFQGKTLAEISTLAGLQSMKLAASNQAYDKVSLNHGIGRLRLDSYSAEIIWDYHGTAPAIIENDEVIHTLESNAEHIISEVSKCISAMTVFIVQWTARLISRSVNAATITLEAFL